MQTYVQRKTEQKKEQFTVYSLVYVYIYIYIFIFKLLLWYFLFFVVEPLDISILLSLVNLQLQVRAKWRWGAWHSGFLSFCVTSPHISLRVRTLGLGGCSCAAKREWRLKSSYHESHKDRVAADFQIFPRLLKWGSKSEQADDVTAMSLARVLTRQPLVRKSPGYMCRAVCETLTRHTNNGDPGISIHPHRPYPKDWKGKC